MATLIQLLAGTIFLLAGVKTLIKKETTLIIRLWTWGGSDNPRAPGGGFSESKQTGFVAILIGLVELAAGGAILLRLFTS